MAVEYFGHAQPAANTETQILSESAAYDFFVGVTCANTGMGDVRVSVYAKAVGDEESDFMYFCKNQIVSGNTTFDTKKLSLSDDHALYVKTSHPIVSFAAVGLKTDKIIEGD